MRANILIMNMMTRSGFIFRILPNISPSHCWASSADEVLMWVKLKLKFPINGYKIYRDFKGFLRQKTLTSTNLLTSLKRKVRVCSFDDVCHLVCSGLGLHLWCTLPRKSFSSAIGGNFSLQRWNFCSELLHVSLICNVGRWLIAYLCIHANALSFPVFFQFHQCICFCMSSGNI